MSPFLRSEYLDSLEQGKYSRWATKIDNDGLVRLLLSIDVLVKAVNDAGGLAEADLGRFLRCARKEQVLDALDTLVCFVSGDLEGEEFAPHWLDGFKDDKPAFNEQVQQRLASGSQTAWAAGLSERDFALLVWTTGFYASRNRFISRDDVETNKIVYGLALLSQAYNEIRGVHGKLGELMLRSRRLKWPMEKDE